MKKVALTLLQVGTMLLFCVACQGPGEPWASPVAVKETERPPSVATATATPEATPEPTLEPTSPVSPTIDLADIDTYRQVNLFLSNFSECALPSFSMKDPDYALLVSRFAYIHAEINSPSLVEDREEWQDDYPVNRRIGEANVLRILQRFCGDCVDAGRVAEVCDNGYYYDLMTNGAPFGYAFALADAVTDLEEDLFEVRFHVYGVPNADCESYDTASSSDIYSAYPDALPRPLHQIAQSFSAAPGRAVLQLAPDQTDAVPYHLVSWECDYQWDS